MTNDLTTMVSHQVTSVEKDIPPLISLVYKLGQQTKRCMTQEGKPRNAPSGERG
jgi:hypothetical protein